MESRRHWVDQVKRVVVKIGSRALVDERNRLDQDRVASLVEQMARVRHAGRELICVSSGSVAAGLGELGLDERPRSVPGQQAAAAIGQARLIGLYREQFALARLTIGQVLLSHADLHSRQRHLNARNTFSHLLARGAVPIVNENDTVAIDEIRFGDNDVLSALVAMLVRADAMIMLTTVDGLLDGPPEDGGSIIDTVSEIDDSIRTLAGAPGSPIARGGMRTKIQAADMVTRAGEYCVIGNAHSENVLERMLRGEPLGTVFEPRPRRMAGRKRWIAFFDHPRGEVHIDGGAAEALRRQGSSLLAAGITSITGAFERGAPVRIVDPDGHEIGRGLANYEAEELRRIAGMRSDQIAETLGVCEYDEVIHRDNLVMR
ncbi:MAG: glutamate 5-kinase [Planctomycetota bacterium]